MDWFATYERRRAAGAHAILFVGSTGDGFPHANASPTGAHTDALESWADAFVRRAANGACTWTYTPLEGFRFPRPSDAQRFHALRAPPPAAQPTRKKQSAIAAVREQLAATNPLPRNPRDAISVMLEVWERAAATVPPTPCLAVLPDIDAIAHDGAIGANSDAQIVALAVLRFATSDAFQRAGHVLCMSTNTITALDERFRLPDAPIEVITIEKPAPDARRAFAVAVTDPHRALERRHAAAVAALEAATRDAREAARAEHAEAQAALRALESRDPAEGSADLARALAARTSAERDIADLGRELDARTAKATVALARKIAARERERDAHPVEDLCADVWKKLRVGDHIRYDVLWGGFTRDTGGWQLQRVSVAQSIRTREHRVLKRLEHGDVELSESGKFESALEAERRTREVFQPGYGYITRRVRQPWRRFFWNGAGISFRTKEGATPMRIPGKLQGTIVRVPAQRLAAEGALRELTRERERLRSRAAPDLHRAWKSSEARVAKAHAQYAKLLKRIRGKWQKEHDALTARIAHAAHAIATPASERIAALLDEVAALERARTEATAVATPRLAVPLDTFVHATSGLGYRDIRAVLRTARADGRRLTAADLTARRLAILRQAYGELFEIMEPAYDFRGVAGLEHVKTFLRGVRDAMTSGDCARVPLGAMFMGPPGTGKTAIAQAFAAECGLLFVKVKDPRRMFVGETEQHMERTCTALRALAPAIVFRDEVDEEDSGRDAFQGDSGVSGRVRRQWMEFLADPTIRGRVFVMSASNRPDRLDAALKRSGRTDERIPILMPDAATRAALFGVMIARYNCTTSLRSFRPYVDRTEGLSGADIEVIVRRATRPDRTVTAQSLGHAIEDFIPDASIRDIARMTLHAIAATSARSFLPDGWKRIVHDARRVLGADDDVPPTGALALAHPPATRSRRAS